jgi:cysteinyl-tRNA synthetase
MFLSAHEYRSSPRPITIYTSLGGTRVVLDPLDQSKVRPKLLVYVCGLTPQDHSHLGHGSMAMRFDMIRRYLMYRRLDVFFMQNVTDIDDKIIAKVLQTGVDPLTMTREYTEEFYRELKRLHVLPVDHLSRVTECVPQIVSFIEDLIKKGFAYATPEGNVYFDVAKKDDYGKLSNQNVSMLFESVRKEAEKDKRSPVDFALWKSDASTSLSHPSPWGVGRPGWHIECSVMIHETLGSRIDIHGGALDLKFPHHENEIAQSEAHSGQGFASIWMHCGLLNIEGQKMSKSLGNFVRLTEGVDRYGSAPLRFAIARQHYRSSVDLSEQLARETLNSILDFHRLFARIPTEDLNLSGEAISDSETRGIIEDFEAAMDNDFNSPEALVALEKGRQAVMFELDKLPIDTPIPQPLKERVYVLRQLGAILGLFFDSLSQFENEGLNIAANARNATPLTPAAVNALLLERRAAREAKDFKRSDELRAQLNAHGVDVLDSKAGSSWRFT